MFKGRLCLRSVKLILLCLTVTLVYMTVENQTSTMSLLRKGTIQNSETSGSTGSIHNIANVIKVRSYIETFVGVKSSKNIVKANRHTENKLCSDEICYHGNISNSSKCRELVSTTRDNIYLINNENTCYDDDAMKEILIFVHSVPKNFARRTAIRKTWGSINRVENYDIKLVFLLGLRNNKTEQAMINRENFLHWDIVQGNFIDSYHNLSQKHVLGLRWASEFCKTARFILKVDDDVFLNPFGFFRELIRQHANITRTILCNVRKNGTDPIQRTDGKRKIKWSVDNTIYENLKHWPFPYCQGYIVIYSRDIISEIYNAASSQCLPYVWLDDVYVTGVLAKNVESIRHSGLKTLRNHIIYFHQSLAENMNKNWNRVKNLPLRHKAT